MVTNPFSKLAPLQRVILRKGTSLNMNESIKVRKQMKLLAKYQLFSFFFSTRRPPNTLNMCNSWAGEACKMWYLSTQWITPAWNHCEEFQCYDGWDGLRGKMDVLVTVIANRWAVHRQRQGLSSGLEPDSGERQIQVAEIFFFSNMQTQTNVECQCSA